MIRLGTHLALVIGAGGLIGAGILAATGGETVAVLILALVGGSALSGWIKARRMTKA